MKPSTSTPVHTIREGLTEPLSCEIHSSFEQLAGMQDEWDQFVIDVGGDIYLSYDWCRIWWEHYGAGKNLCVFVYRRERQLVALIPLFIEQVSVGFMRLRIAKTVGSDFTMCVLNPPIHDQYAAAVLLSLVKHLVDTQKCDAVLLGPVTGNHIAIAPLHEICPNQSRQTVIAHHIPRSTCTTFALPSTFDTYINLLSKNQQRNYRRYMNQLTKEFKVKCDVVSDPPQAESEFVAFMRMHGLQWQVEGKLGHFGDWPLGAEFNSALVKRQAELGRLRLIRLIADGQVVAYEYCYSFGDRYHARLSARAIGEKWDRYGIGRIGVLKIIEQAISEGAGLIEAGTGHYNYMVQLGGIEQSLRCVLIARNRLASRLRTRILFAAAYLVHLLYFRIWFNRLAPMLPLSRRPLWKSWIHLRLFVRVT